MRVIPITSWKGNLIWRTFYHQYMKQASAEDQVRMVVMGCDNVNENIRSF